MAHSEIKIEVMRWLITTIEVEQGANAHERDRVLSLLKTIPDNRTHHLARMALNKPFDDRQRELNDRINWLNETIRNLRNNQI